MIISPGISFSYLPEKTHPLINNKAAGLSKIGDYLLNQLGLSEGTQKIINGKTLIEWLQDGGKDEDSPPIRGAFHFHDPTESWVSAGFYNAAFSSLDWAQNKAVGAAPTCVDLSAFGVSCPEPPPAVNFEFSWPGARAYFYQALTSSVLGIRDQYFAKTFESLGHVMHLLADAAVPEHTRNDAHVMKSQYEVWAEENAEENNEIQPSLISLLIQDNFMIYPVDYTAITNISHVPNYIPISNFWDTTPNPGYGGTLLGLAEYTNYNFLSPGTIFKNYTYPANPQLTSGYIQIVHDIDEEAFERVYFSGSTSDGRPIEHLVSTGYLWSDLENISPVSMDTASFVLDHNCFYDYASILIPKAVAYDTALLDYFFRGKLEVSAPDRCLYGLIDGSIIPQQFTKIKVNIGNISYIDDQQTVVETMESGTFHAVAKYKNRTDYQPPDLPVEPPTNNSIESTFSYSVSEPINLTQEDLDTLNTSYKDFTFDFISNPIPAGITDLYLYVIFKGTLGYEMDNAIAVGFKDLSEPTHFITSNTTDYLYQSGQLFTSTDQEKVTINEKIAFCPSQIPVQDDNEYQVEYAGMSPGAFGRLIYISDPDIQNYYFYVKDTPINKPNVPVDEIWYDIWAAENQDGAASEVDEFRGKASHDAMHYICYSDFDENFWLAPWPDIATSAIPTSPLNW